MIAKKEPISVDIDKKEEPIVEEKPKEEIEIKEEVEEKEIPEERVPEEIILEERMPEEKEISDERKEEIIERIVVEKKDEAVQTDDDIDRSSSESIYSYSMYIIYIYISLHHISTYQRMPSNVRNLLHKLSVKVIIDACASLSRRITRDRN